MGRLSAARRWQMVGAVGLAALLVLALRHGLDIGATNPSMAALVLALFAVNALWLSGAALTAIAGVRPSDGATATPARTPPARRCAVLWLVCGEDPAPIAARVRDFASDLETTGQASSTLSFILSDTVDPAALSRERAAFAGLGADVVYRNRLRPTGRKPGNLRDWLDAHGEDFDTMLVLDADSGFSAARLERLRATMAANPDLGLLQCGIRLRPGRSRFVHLQRLSTRLCGPAFSGGLARLSGDAGNYWGHNALIRVAAFRQVARLPALSGTAPMGGEVLSHDFIEAAFMRRAGWHVCIDPATDGSLEDAPETVAAHVRRDRRWAQGNLQHLRLIGARGLHPASRLHLLAGIQTYLSAPIWLALVVLFGSGTVHASDGAVWPLLGTLSLLVVPKLAGVLSNPRRLGTPWRRAVVWRGFAGELALSTLFAPLSMVRSTGFVAAVALGRDAGWVPAGRGGRAAMATGAIESFSGAAILLAVTLPQALIGNGAPAALWAGLIVMPVTLPLLAAPWVISWFDTARPPLTQERGAARRGSGRPVAAARPGLEAPALHRALGAPGRRAATAAGETAA